MPGKANSEDDQGAAAAAPADPKSDLTVAMKTPMGTRTIPQRLLHARTPEQLTLERLPQEPFATDILYSFANLAQTMQRLDPAAASAPVRIAINLPAGALALYDQGITNLLTGLKPLAHPSQALALPSTIPARSQLGQLVVNNKADTLLVMLKFIQQCLKQPSNTRLVFTKGTRGWSVTNNSGKEVFIFQKSVLDALAQLSGPAGNMTLQAALQDAVNGVVDFAQNNCLAVNPLACTTLKELVAHDPAYGIGMQAIALELAKVAGNLQNPAEGQIIISEEIKLLAPLNIPDNVLDHIIRLMQAEAANPTLALATRAQLGLPNSEGTGQSTLVPFAGLTSDAVKLVGVLLKARRAKQGLYSVRTTTATMFGFAPSAEELGALARKGKPAENLVMFEPTRFRELATTISNLLGQALNTVSSGAIPITFTW